MKIEWAEPAIVDLESIRDYIKKDSDYYAIRFVERIIEAVENLVRFPKRGRIVPEAGEDNIREILFYYSGHNNGNVLFSDSLPTCDCILLGKTQSQGHF